MKYGLLSGVVFACALSGCNSNQTMEQQATASKVETEMATTQMLAQTQWQLQKLNGEVAAKGQGGKPIFMRFDDTKRQVSGFSGCNNYFGQYSVNEQALSFSHFAMTKKFCKNTMQLEASFAKAMAQVKAYQLKETMLQLLDENQQVLAEFVVDK